MSARYWDTSCVLPLYVPEPDSARLAELAAGQDDPIASSQILGFEFLFAIHARVARRQIPKDFAAKVQRKFMVDAAAGRFLMIPLGDDLLSTVAAMTAKLVTCAPGLEVRTLDGIHLATATRMDSEEVVTTDKRMRKAAKLLGLQVLPGEG